MAWAKGRAEQKRFLLETGPAELRRLLLVAGRAGANVIAAKARDLSISSEVSEAVKVKVKADETKVVATVYLKGPGAYKGRWLEWGTDPHFISVDASQRDGRSVRRINDLAKEGSLVINGHFVGDTVLHPGAERHPFLRPALDLMGTTAIATAQAVLNRNVKPTGITIPADAERDA